MMKVFAKTSGVILSIALLFSTIPAMALNTDAIKGMFAAKEDVQKVAPSLYSKAIALLPSWKATKDTLSSMLKKGATLINDHPVASAAVALTATGLVVGYEYRKSVVNARAKTALHDACVNAKDALQKAIAQPARNEEAQKTVADAMKAVMDVRCGGACKKAQREFINISNRIIQRMAFNATIDMADLDRIIASLAPAAQAQNQEAGKEAKPAAPAQNADQKPAAQNAEQAAADANTKPAKPAKPAKKAAKKTTENEQTDEALINEYMANHPEVKDRTQALISIYSAGDTEARTHKEHKKKQ